MPSPPPRISERQLRTALCQRLSDGLADDAQLMEELGIEHGGARIDVAVVNGELVGYEIKSDYDSLDRLANQMRAYNRVFDELTIVTTAKFADQAQRLLPPWWGIWEATVEDAAVALAVSRAPSQNPEQDALSLLSLLWRDEAIALLRERNGARVKSKLNRAAIYKQLAPLADVPTIRDWVSNALRNRTAWHQAPAVKSASPAS